MADVSISTPHHQLKAYVATPAGQGPCPGVIVLRDIFGLTGVTCRHADWMAHDGYLAVARNLFSWGGYIRCIRALMQDLTARRGPVFDDIDAVRQWLTGRPDCSNKTGIIGFFATGGFAILLAAGHKGLIGVLGAALGASYKGKDAADARSRIRTFFAHHLAL